MKPKYNGNVKLCYTDTDSFVMNIKTHDFYKDITNDVKKRFDTSNYEVNRSLPTGKNKIKELFYRGHKINISIVLITQSYFTVLKDARINSTHYILMKISNKK